MGVRAYISQPAEGDWATFCPAVPGAGSICPARYLIEVSIAELGELARLFLKLGALGFGGPAAYTALM